MQRQKKAVAFKSHIKIPTDLLEAIQHFSDPKFCHKLIATLRWAGGVPVCPRCSFNQSYYCTTRQTWKCKACEKHFSVKLGTIFEDSHVSLEQWLPALWLMAQGQRDVSFRKLAELLGTTHRTVWFMFHRVRLTTRTGTFRKKAAPPRSEYAA